VKTHLFRALNVALSAAAVLLAHAPVVAQTTARPDKIMTISELRVCMKMQQANDASARNILDDQQAFSRDQTVVKAEQAEVNKGNDELRAKIAALTAERNTMNTDVAALSDRAQSAKTDEEKAAYEKDRQALIERNRLYEQNAAKVRETQEAQLVRINALNARIDALNARQGPLNDRVEPQQKKVATWREQCGNRRFREEDEIVIKKELAAGK
jgi:hypothetical protein